MTSTGPRVTDPAQRIALQRSIDEMVTNVNAAAYAPSDESIARNLIAHYRAQLAR
jgi:hypothetical protein